MPLDTEDILSTPKIILPYAGSDRYIFDAAFYVYEKEVSMAYWVKWGYSDKEIIALIKFSIREFIIGVNGGSFFISMPID